MSQHEVGEVTEPVKAAALVASHGYPRRSSSACMAAWACAHHAPQRVAALLAAMSREDAHAADTWPVEWTDWSQLLMSAHGSARALAQMLPGLQVHPERMRAHIDGLRAQLSKNEAETCFDPALALEAGQITRQQLQLLQGELGSHPPGAAAG